MLEKTDPHPDPLPEYRERGKDGLYISAPACDGSPRRMKGKPKKSPREKDITSRYLSGGLDEDRVEQQQRFSDRNKHAQANKMIKTAAMRAGEDDGAVGDVSQLPIGEVVQVYSLFLDVRYQGKTYLCSVRK